MEPFFEYWIGIDFSSPLGTLSLHKVGKKTEFLHELTLSNSFTHAEKIIPAFEDLLKTSNLPVSSITRFITTSGPGSFTGLRISIATLKGFAFALNKPIETIGGSEARALGWMSDNGRQLEDFQTTFPVYLAVITRVSQSRFVMGTFIIENPSSVVPLEESLQLQLVMPDFDRARTFLLLDSFTRLEEIAEPWRERAQVFPLRAKYLAPALATAKTRKTYASLGEWIALSPQYFGLPFKAMVK